MRSRGGGTAREQMHDATDGHQTSVQLQSTNAQTPPKAGEYRRPESKTIQQLAEPDEICKTSTPGSNPGGASNPNQFRSTGCRRTSRGKHCAIAASWTQVLRGGPKNLLPRGRYSRWIDPQKGVLRTSCDDSPVRCRKSGSFESVFSRDEEPRLNTSAIAT